MEQKQMGISDRLHREMDRRAMARRLQELSKATEGAACPAGHEQKEDEYGDGHADDSVPH